jgi:hypothetical protein
MGGQRVRIGKHSGSEGTAIGQRVEPRATGLTSLCTWRRRLSACVRALSGGLRCSWGEQRGGSRLTHGVQACSVPARPESLHCTAWRHSNAHALVAARSGPLRVRSESGHRDPPKNLPKSFEEPPAFLRAASGCPAGGRSAVRLPALPVLPAGGPRPAPGAAAAPPPPGEPPRACSDLAATRCPRSPPNPALPQLPSGTPCAPACAGPPLRRPRPHPRSPPPQALLRLPRGTSWLRCHSYCRWTEAVGRSQE